MLTSRPPPRVEPDAHILSVNVASSAEQEFTYDANGNMHTDGSGRTFTWDAENRLTEIAYPETGNTTEFQYDALGRNIQIAESGSITGTKNFLWCGSGRCQERNSLNTVTKEFFGLGEKVGSDIFYFTTDHLGSVREVTDSSISLQSQYDYSPLGEPTRIAGTGLGTEFEFAGMYLHTRSGLDLTMYRSYSPEVGRWLSRDPLGEPAGTNLYAYAANDPIDRTDFLGLQAQSGNSSFASALNDLNNSAMRLTNIFGGREVAGGLKNYGSAGAPDWQGQVWPGGASDNTPRGKGFDFNFHNHGTEIGWGPNYPSYRDVQNVMRDGVGAFVSVPNGTLYFITKSGNISYFNNQTNTWDPYGGGVPNSQGIMVAPKTGQPVAGPEPDPRFYENGGNNNCP